MGELMASNCFDFIFIQSIDNPSGKNDPTVFGTSSRSEGIEAIVVENSNVGGSQSSGDTQILYYIIDLGIFNPCDRSRTSKFENDLSIEEERNYSSE